MPDKIIQKKQYCRKILVISALTDDIYFIESGWNFIKTKNPKTL